MADTEVVMIGAGPNGLSVAAHLRSLGVSYRGFGHTMGAWRFNMPKGMILKSEPYASDVCAPERGYTAGDYCRAVHEKYYERVIPLSKEQFIAYGDWFSHNLVPDIEDTEVVSLSQTANGFLVRTAADEAIVTPSVVVATGIMPFSYVPPELAALPPQLVSHTTTHADFTHFRGREVLVVGRGQSALETSALLHEEGAAVKVVVRGDGVAWNSPNPEAPSRLERLRRPVVRLCESWPCWFYDRLPDVFLHMPESWRIEHGLGVLGPSGAWWLRERVENRIPILTGRRLMGAEAVGDRVRVHLDGPDGPSTETADHVIAGTGFRFDLDRLTYLDRSLKAQLRVVAGAPAVDRYLESSVSGLFFCGALAAPSLGPLMRFVAGTAFTGPRVAGRIHSSLRRARRRVSSHPRP